MASRRVLVGGNFKAAATFAAAKAQAELLSKAELPASVGKLHLSLSFHQYTLHFCCAS